MKGKPPRDLEKLLEDDEAIEAAVRRGVRDALRFHKAIGNPVVFFDEEGRETVVPPEDLVIPEEEV